MDNKIKLPDEFDPPLEVIRDDYILEALAPRHNEMDFEAWTSSKDELKGIFGPKNNWPQEVISIDQNLHDLEKHYNEFLSKVAFTYTILNSERNLCIGCLYIRPTSAKGFDCRVDFWFRNSAKCLEPAFYKELNHWLKTKWGFQKIAYPGRNLSWKEYYRLAD